MKKIAYQDMYQNELTHAWYVGTRRHLIKIIGKFIRKNDEILDVGCGTGGTINFLNSSGYENTRGIDISTQALFFCKKRGIKRVRKCSINKLPFADNSFSAVICLDVLYHKRVNVNRALSECYRVLKKNGILYVQEPAYDWLKSRHDIQIETRHRFTKNQLSSLLKDNHITVISNNYFNTILFPLMVLKRVIDKLGTSSHSDVQTLSPIVNNILLTCLRLESATSQYLSPPYGLSIICVGKKTS